MDFVEFVKRLNRDLHDACDKGALQRLGREMEQAEGLAPLLDQGSPALRLVAAGHLHRLANAHRQFVARNEALRQVRRLLAASGLGLPDGCLQEAAAPHEIRALERTARMCQRSGHADHESWSKAALAHLDLWRASVAIGLAEGRVTIAVAKPEDPDAPEFAAHATTKTGIADIRGYHWLGARRGERAGILTVTMSLPAEALQAQAEARLPSLGLVAERRGARSILEELVENDLLSTIRALTDTRAQAEALASACTAYLGLLETPPLKAETVLSIYIGSAGAPAGIALLNGAGELMAQHQVPAGRALADEISALIAQHRPDAAVLPSSSADNLRLREALDAVKALSVVRVYRASMGEALRALPYPKPIAGAVVLGKRALYPAEEWAKVPPESLGLGEYTGEIDSGRLVRELTEARLVWSFEKQQGGTQFPRKASGPGPSAAVYKRLNPLVRTIFDLKPGMVLNGVVTNLTHFGAFVNIGISKEAMIHISQLADEFVDDPSKLLRIGQSVTAAVIEVAPEKNRIALTMKGGQPAPRPRGAMSPGPQIPPALSEGPLPPHPERKKNRQDALFDLHALFKK